MPRNCKKVYSLDLDGRSLAIEDKILSLMKLISNPEPGGSNERRKLLSV